MAPLPPNSTPRVYFDYISGNAATSKAHTASLRMNQGTFDQAQVQALFAAVLASMGQDSFRVGWKVTSVRVQQANSSFSLPVPLIPGLSSFQGTNAGAWTENQEAIEWTFQARSGASGRRVDFSLFGVYVTIPTNFRYVAGAVGSPAWVGNVVGLLNNTSTYPQLPVAVDGTRATFYPYVNANYNSYWEGEIRRS